MCTMSDSMVQNWGRDKAVGAIMEGHGKGDKRKDVFLD